MDLLDIIQKNSTIISFFVGGGIFSTIVGYLLKDYLQRKLETRNELKKHLRPLHPIMRDIKEDIISAKSLHKRLSSNQTRYNNIIKTISNNLNLYQNQYSTISNLGFLPELEKEDQELAQYFLGLSNIWILGGSTSLNTQLDKYSEYSQTCFNLLERLLKK